MDPTKRFLEYAAAFEQTYADDDWSRLEPFFCDDAAYTVSGGEPLGGRFEGREQVLARLRDAVNQLDRRFDERRVVPVSAPVLGEAWLELAWRATYRKAGCPDLVFGGTERAHFEGTAIRLLEDEMEEGADRRIQEYLQRYLS